MNTYMCKYTYILMYKHTHTHAHVYINMKKLSSYI